MPAAASPSLTVRFPEELVAVPKVVVAEDFPIPPEVFFLASKHILSGNRYI